MGHSLKIAISIIKPVFYYAATKGISADDILSKANINSDILKTPDNRVSIDVMDRIYKQAMLLTKDDNIGLHAGEFFLPGSANILGHICMNCQSAGEILQKVLKYIDILTEGVKIEVNTQKDGMTIINKNIRHLDVSLTRQHVEYAFSSSIKLISTLLEKPVTPIEVRFQHKKPRDISEHQRIFNAPLKFEHSMNALVFDNIGADYPVQQPNAELMVFFEQHAKKILTSIHSEKPVTKKVSFFIAGNFHEELPTIKTVATKLSMSVRSLQRNLEKENTSYREIFNQVYKKLAISYLMNGEISVAEIAYIMGFSEPSSFHRTFKRWTGLTPNVYRVTNKTE